MNRIKDATKTKPPKAPPRMEPSIRPFLDFDEDAVLLVPFAIIGEGGGEDEDIRLRGGQKVIS